MSLTESQSLKKVAVGDGTRATIVIGCVYSVASPMATDHSLVSPTRARLRSRDVISFSSAEDQDDQLVQLDYMYICPDLPPKHSPRRNPLASTRRLVAIEADSSNCLFCHLAAFKTAAAHS